MNQKNPGTFESKIQGIVIDYLTGGTTLELNNLGTIAMKDEMKS